MSGRAATALRIVAINVLVLAGLLIVIEGAASGFLVARDLVMSSSEAEPYTRYDRDLGWVNKPNITLQNAFDNGAWVRTNGRSFRSVADTAPAVAPGRFRVICSGDSFTFGDGVDNDHTWCQQLAARDPRIEPVNLGESGYGADQAYRRYVRDARDLQHQVHVFAFIADDFDRMADSTFLGFGKPVLAVERGALVARNVPVPASATRARWLAAIAKAVADTRTASLIDRVRTKLRRAAPAAETDQQRIARTQVVVRALFASLERISEGNGSRLVLLYQPVLDDLDTVRPNEWTRFLEHTARELQIPFVNSADAFRVRGGIRDLFLWDGTAAGHYSNTGHAVVADVLFTQLKELQLLP